MAQKSELLRFVWAPPGMVVFDVDQALPGRGTYIHRRVQCWARSGDIKRWQNALFPSSQHRKGEGGTPRITKENIERVVEEVRGHIAELAS